MGLRKGVLQNELQHASKKRCHPERLKKIEDFRRESKDLRTDLTANLPSLRRSFDSICSLRMTDFRCVAKTVFCNAPEIYRMRSSQKATAAAAATFKESTPWDMGIFTV